MSRGPLKKSVTDASKLNGAEKAAVILLSLGEEHHALWEALDDEEIKEISQAMSTLGTVSATVVEGGPRRLNRRLTVSPSRSNSVPMLLAAGQAVCGLSRSSQVFTFAGPQVGCARRTPRQASTMSPASAWGCLRGARG